MDVGRKSYRKLAAQDSRLRVYGGQLYGSIYWIPADTGVNQQPEIDEEDNQGPVGKLNHICRLPDELITRHVFDKISEAKCLCNCSLVSKHFASLVPDTQTVTLKIPAWRPVCSCHQDPATRRLSFSSRLGELFNFLSKPIRFIWWLLGYPFRQEPETHYPDVIRTKPPAVKNFLKKFSCIKSLSIDLSFSGVISSPRFEPLVRWKCDKSGFIFVSAKSRDDEELGVGAADDVVVENANGLTQADAFGELDLISYHFMDAVWRVAFVDSILDDFPHVKNVLVMDCMKQGRVVLDEEEIAGARDIQKILEKVYCCVKVWHLPVVKLPLSGCVMKEATLCIFKEVGIDDGLMAENAFEEKEYCELARTMVKKESCYEIKVSASEVNGRIRFVIGEEKM
ncbi:hypothetical protein Pfo_027733 [Paulownia fortunei]|nr:hypothetical protein Pfo_027733 [Paulownia fortunei]